MTMPNPHVAIIGSGLSGLCLALALDQQGIKSIIYESRATPLNIGGAVMLSPNALRILDSLKLYTTIEHQGHNFDTLHFRNAAGELIEEYPFGSKSKYGYRGLRIFRTVLINAMLEAVRASSHASIQFGRKFHHVVSETESDVTFAFADASETTATLVVGADGIHSTVRRYLYPDLAPKFTGMGGVTAAVPTAQLNLPEGYHIPVTIVNPKHGAFVIAPQGASGEEVLIGRQKRFPTGAEEPTRQGWDAVHANKAASVAFLRSGIVDAGEDSGFPELVHNALREVDEKTVNVWPFYVVPRLESWVSGGGRGGGEEQRHGGDGRVVILGDAAHAIPPSAGQGINQAFEDSYMLGLLMGGLQQREAKGAVGVGEAMRFWQGYRQARVDRILDLNRQIDLRRMPKGDGAGEETEREEFDLGWLYQPDILQDVQEWMATQ